MSYSRWSNSEWYVFWHVGDVPLLAIWHTNDTGIPVFTEHEVRKWAGVIERHHANGGRVKLWDTLGEVSAQDAWELKGYIDKWLGEVENERNRSSTESDY